MHARTTRHSRPSRAKGKGENLWEPGQTALNTLALTSCFIHQGHRGLPGAPADAGRQGNWVNINANHLSVMQLFYIFDIFYRLISIWGPQKWWPAGRASMFGCSFHLPLSSFFLFLEAVTSLRSYVQLWVHGNTAWPLWIRASRKSDSVISRRTGVRSAEGGWGGEISLSQRQESQEGGKSQHAQCLDLSKIKDKRQDWGE